MRMNQPEQDVEGGLFCNPKNFFRLTSYFLAAKLIAESAYGHLQVSIQALIYQTCSEHTGIYS